MRTRRAPALAIPLLALALGGGVVVAAQATGSWSTTGRDAAAGTGRSAGTGSSGTGPSAGATGESVDRTAGPATPADVKGWMTLRQVLDASFPGVTEAALRTEFAIPATFSSDSALKDLDGVATGFDMAALREWLAAPG